MSYLFCILSIVLILLGSLAIILRYFNNFHKVIEGFNPELFSKTQVNIFVPCKGLEINLERNLRAYVEQAGDNVKLYFITESTSDPAVDVIKQVIQKNPNCFHVVAPYKEGYSRKISKVLYAVEQNPNADIYVFGDSDICPTKEWLLNLTIPLIKDKKIGVATGYRWYCSDKFSLWNHVVTMWNGFILFYMFFSVTRFVWGGSYALRSDLFNSLNIKDVWYNVVTEDFTLSNFIKSKKYKIFYVSTPLNISRADFSFSTGFEWTTRQLMLSKYYYKGLYLTTFLFCIFSLVLCLINPLYFFVLFIVIGILIVFIANFSLAKQNSKIKISYSVSLFMIPSLFMCYANLIATLFKNKIKWRGTTYHIISSKKMNVIHTSVIK